MSEFVDPFEQEGRTDEAVEGIQYVGEDGEPEVTPESKDAHLEEKVTPLPPPPSLPALGTAADLLDEETPPDPEELGFEPPEPGGEDVLYRGQLIVDVGPQDPRHEYLFDPKTAPGGEVRAFYVQTKNGTIGLVPWAGSDIIWPHEVAWAQDLYHEKQSGPKKAIIDAFLAAQKKKAEKK